MTVAVDASTPVNWTGTPTTAASITSASFTARANAFLVLCLMSDDNAVADQVYTCSDSGSLAWTSRVKRGTTETTAGGMSEIVTARTTSAVSRTISVIVASGT